MNNTEILILILSTTSLLLSVYNLYQTRKNNQPKLEKLTCSFLFCPFTTEDKEELTDHEKNHHE